MEEVCFIKCEPEDPADKKESNGFPSEAETPATSVLKVKVEPDLTYTDPGIQVEVPGLGIKEEPITQELQKVVEEEDKEAKGPLSNKWTSVVFHTYALILLVINAIMFL